MPLSHNALWRDTSEPVGFNGKPRYPLTGPYVYYDTRDHLHGATGYTTVTVGTPGPFNSTGKLPNSGSAGSIADMDVFQTSRWRTDYGMAEYITMGEIDSFDISPNPPAPGFDLVTGGGPSVGPYCWIMATGALDDTRLIDGTGWRRGFMDSVYQLLLTYITGTQIQSVFRPTLDYNSGTPAQLTFTWGSTFWNEVTSTGASGSDISRATGFTVDMDAYAGQLNNRLVIDMVDVVTGLTDCYVNGKWMTDHLDGDLGIDHLYPGFGAVYEDWWDLPDTVNATERNRDRQGNPTNFGDAAMCDRSYNNIKRNWFVNTGQWEFYDSKPIQGDPWPAWRAMGLWRGAPTAADLAVIAADMGVSV